MAKRLIRGFLALVVWLVWAIPVTNSRFSDVGQSQNSFFVAGDWTRPESEITSTEWLVKSSNFEITYQADDNAIDYVQLWYSYNDSPWQLFGVDYPNSPGSFQFTSPEGDGLYRFLTVAVDQSGNVEDRDGDNIDDNSDQEALNRAYLAWVDSADPDIATEIQVDTEPPTMNLSLANIDSYWAGENLIKNGDFADMTGWVAGGKGDHHIVADGENLDGEVILPQEGKNLFILGFKDHSLSAWSNDWLYQEVDLPAQLSSNLVFNWRMISEDSVDYDWFSVFLKDENNFLLDTILKTGSGGVDISGWEEDSGWRRISYPLLNFSGRRIRVWFETVNSHDDQGRSWVYLDNVQITTADNRIPENQNLGFEVYDASGSGELASYYSLDNNPEEDYLGEDIYLEAGDHQINYWAEDFAGNSSATRSADLVVQPNIVLNKIMANPLGNDQGSSGLPLDGEWVELFNNSDEDVDLTDWYLTDSYYDSHILPITENNIDTDGDLNDSDDSLTIPAHGWLRVYRNGDSDFALNNTDGDQVRLYDATGQLIDQFEYQVNIAEGALWQRHPDGLGSWQLVPAGIEAQITSRYPQAHKILLTIFNIPQDYGKDELLEYEITYSTPAGEKGIAGQILPESVVAGKADREFYLGICSAGGTCVPDIVSDQKVKLTLTRGRDENGDPKEIIIDQRQFDL